MNPVARQMLGQKITLKTKTFLRTKQIRIYLDDRIRQELFPLVPVPYRMLNDITCTAFSVGCLVSAPNKVETVIPAIKATAQSRKVRMVNCCWK